MGEIGRRGGRENGVSDHGERRVHHRAGLQRYFECMRSGHPNGRFWNCAHGHGRLRSVVMVRRPRLGLLRSLQQILGDGAIRATRDGRPGRLVGRRGDEGGRGWTRVEREGPEREWMRIVRWMQRSVRSNNDH